MTLTTTHRAILSAMARVRNTPFPMVKHETEAGELEKMGLVIRIDQGYNAPTWRLTEAGRDALSIESKRKRMEG